MNYLKYHEFIVTHKENIFPKAPQKKLNKSDINTKSIKNNAFLTIFFHRTIKLILI